MMKYEFAMHRRKITIKATINGTTDVDLILDTGAGTTVLSERTALLLGYNPGKLTTSENFVAAGGSVNAKILKLDKLEAFGMEVGKFNVAILPLPLQILADGLLGVDFLRLLKKFSINFETNHIELD
jgi:clan AA aspartic protease (TIGR02281 family)